MNKIELNVLLKILVFFLFVYLFFLIIKPFIPAIILALAFAIIFYPLTDRMKKKRVGEAGAAFLTVLITFIFIILPLATLIGMIAREAVVFSQNLNLEALGQALNTISAWDLFGYHLDLNLIKEKLLGIMGSIGSYASGKSLAILSSISGSLFLFFVFLLLYFYFLKDGKQLLLNLQKILPFEKNEQQSLFKAFRDISRTIFYGNLFTAIIAGVIAYLGFLIFGFKGLLIWALLAAIFSFIPTLGTLLIYLTGIVILAFTEGWLWAVLFLLYFILVDLLFRETFIRGKVLEDKLKFHPILVFLALVGGVSAFGSLGLIYGPLIVTFLGALYQFQVEKKRVKSN